MQDDAENYFESKEKKDFDRVKTASSFMKIQEFKEMNNSHSSVVFTHNPVTHYAIEEENENQEANKILGNTRKKESNSNFKDVNELFILKLVFDAMDKVILISISMIPKIKIN